MRRVGVGPVGLIGSNGRETSASRRGILDIEPTVLMAAQITRIVTGMQARLQLSLLPELARIATRARQQKSNAAIAPNTMGSR
jgi:hypothetical protein